jgi:uncharacterized protein (TIGR02266 family)
LVDGIEKRKHHRAPLMLKVRYGHALDFLADYSVNISEGGIFIATDEKFEMGSIIDFEISFPGLLDPIQIRGEIKWYKSAISGDDVTGIGVQFLADQGKAGSALSTLVKRLTDPNIKPLKEQLEDVIFRVLLVEDNVVVRDMFRYGIQKMTRAKDFPGSHLEVVEAENGKQAWDIMQEKSCDLLILDLYMPVMDGNQLIHHVRAEDRFRSLPIIVVSSGGAEDREKALKAGADIFLSKPIKLKEIVETVEILISTGHFPRNK